MGVDGNVLCRQIMSELVTGTPCRLVGGNDHLCSVSFDFLGLYLIEPFVNFSALIVAGCARIMIVYYVHSKLVEFQGKLVTLQV